MSNEIQKLDDSADIKSEVFNLIQALESKSSLSLRANTSKVKGVITSLNMEFIKSKGLPQAWKNVEKLGESIDHETKRLENLREMRDRDMAGFEELDMSEIDLDEFILKENKWTEIINRIETNLSKKMMDWNREMKTLGLGDSSDIKAINIYNKNEAPAAVGVSTSGGEVIMVDAPEKDEEHDTVRDMDFTDI